MKDVNDKIENACLGSLCAMYRTDFLDTLVISFISLFNLVCGVAVSQGVERDL